MAELEPMIKDLALILIIAGAMTLIFKRLGQPVVLGYIVAGFLAGPHFGLLPSVADTVNVHLWSDIGVIFLLFALGLEFSFKKILKVGGTAVVAALVIIVGMIFLGFTVGSAFGWDKMNSLFLGGMIAMSSTTIIYKAFEDLGLRQKQFTGLVLSILILEDVLAVVLMVMLSTIAVSSSVDGLELVKSIAKLAFFLILWFVVGLYLIPLILKKARKHLSGETLLIVSLGLCFGMVVFASAMGFSAAFGAFIMGSILAETIEAERIDKLVGPVKDLFGAVFFVSVGMMVDPAMISQFALPIIIITLTVIFGQATFASIGVLLSGKSLKTAVQSGFSLTQIGEFAFIIAALGQSLKVTSDFLYPIVVAVSVITIFITPYMIRLSDPFYSFLEKHLPKRFLATAEKLENRTTVKSGDTSHWKSYIKNALISVIVYGIIAVSINTIGFSWFVPFVNDIFSPILAKIISAVAIGLALSPFVYNIVLRRAFGEDFKALWNLNRRFAPLLVIVSLFRVWIGMSFYVYVLFRLFHFRGLLVFGLAFLVLFIIVSSRFMKRQSRKFEATLKDNLRARDAHAEHLGKKKPDYASRLMSKDLHFADFTVPGDTSWAGKTLAELNLGRVYGIHVASILRGDNRINIPDAHEHVYPQDVLQVIGTDSDVEAFSKGLSSSAASDEGNAPAVAGEMVLDQILVREDSPFCGKDIRQCGIRSHYHCLIAGVETAGGKLHLPAIDIPFIAGDVIWVVGQKDDVAILQSL